MKRMVIVLPLVVMLCSCSSATKRHLGKWEAAGIGVERYAVDFANKGKAEVTTPEGIFPGQYIIDYSKTPIRLDVSWDGRTIRCILEFLDEGSFKIIGEDDPAKLRPLDFKPEEDVVVFRKIITKKKKK